MIVTVLGEPVRGTSLLINSGYSSGIALGGSNSGAGFGLYQSTANGILAFKSLTAGTGITLTNNTNDINIAVPSSYITGIITTSYINTNATAKVAKAGDSMTGALAMGGNKITGLAAASANGDAVRFEQLPAPATISGTPSMLYKVITIGDWNMNVSVAGLSAVSVAHGVDYTKIRMIDVIIRPDDDATFPERYLTITGNNPSTLEGIARLFDTTNVQLSINTGSFFDTNRFDKTSFNRGWITILYEA